MTSLFNEIRKEIVGILIFLIVVIAFLFIYETLKTMPNSTPEIQKIAEQGEQFTIGAFLLYIALPSTAVIGIIVFIIKKIKEESEEVTNL